MNSFLDALGFTLVAILLFGAPIIFVLFYGIYVAIRFGIKGQPTDYPQTDTKDIDRAA